MKPTSMISGGIYNLTEATSGYKRTVLVLRTKPVFTYVVLHYQYGNPWSKDIRSTPFIEKDPVRVFRNESISLSQSTQDWHIQAIRKNSLSALIKTRVISVSTFQAMNVNPGHLSSSNLGVSLRLDIEGKSAHESLKSAFVCWESMSAAMADLSKHGVPTF